MKLLVLFLSFCCLIAGKVSAHRNYVFAGKLPLSEISGAGTPVLINVVIPQSITVDGSTANQICGSKGTTVVVNYTTTGTFDSNNFAASLIQITRRSCYYSPVETNIKWAYAEGTGTVTFTLPSDIDPTNASSCVTYKLVVSNGSVNSAAYPVTVVSPPTVPAVSGATNVTGVGQSITLSTPVYVAGTKQWYAHTQTQYWQPGTLLTGQTSDNLIVTPETSSFYSVVYTETATGCSARSSRAIVNFTVTVTGTNSVADLTYREGQGVHLDASGIVGAGSPYPQYYVPSSPDAGTQVYSTVFDTGYPTSWSGYFIIRKSDYWEIYSGSRPTYGPPSYTRVFHTKNAFPTSNPGGRVAARTSAVTGTRPPQNAVWIKDADNTEIALTLTGVSEDYGALPVTLTYFNAKVNDDRKVALAWETTSEQNSDYFDVERSADLKTYNVVATVKAKENKLDKTVYQLIDETPVPGIGYYRLKQVDLDGIAQYYKVVSVRTEGTDAPYPNPSNGQLLNLDVPATSNISILNLKGESIPFDLKTLSESSVQLLLTTRLSPGLYLITVNGLTRKWVVQ